MTRIGRRTFLGGGAALAAMATLSACGGSSKPADGAADSGQTAITLWHGFTEADGKVVNQIIDAFNASQDMYKVNPEVIAWSSIGEKLLTSLSAGGGPDLVVQGVDSGPGYAEQGAFVSLQDFYDDTATYTSTTVLYDNVVDQVTWDGQTYGVPMGVSAFAIWYNTAMWQEAGLTEQDYPTTVEELIDVAKRLTKTGADGTPEQYGISLPDSDSAVLATMLHSGGGDFITDGKVSIDSPANVATMKMWQKAVVEDRISPTGQDVVAAAQLFQAGKAAMILNGPWQLVAAQSSGVDVGVFQWPGDWVEAVSLYWFATSMVSGEEKKKAAYAFLDFWNSYDQQVLWTSTYYPPNRTDIDPAELSDPLVGELAGFSGQAHYYATGITSNVSDIMNETGSMMSQIMSGGDVETLLSQTQKTVEGYMAG